MKYSYKLVLVALHLPYWNLKQEKSAKMTENIWDLFPVCKQTCYTLISTLLVFLPQFYYGACEIYTVSCEGYVLVDNWLEPAQYLFIH